MAQNRSRDDEDDDRPSPRRRPDDDDDDRPRSRRRAENDDDRDDDDRPRRRVSAKKGKDNTTMMVLLILGGLFLLVVLVCGGIGTYAFVSARKAVAERQAKLQAEVERARQQAQVQAQAQNVAVQNNDMGRAQKVAADMVAFLKQSKFDAAYNLTSSNYKSKTSLAQFTTLMKPIADEFGPGTPTVLPEPPFTSPAGDQYTFKMFWTGSQDVQFIVRRNNGTWQIDQINTKLSWFGQQKQKQKK